MGWFRAPLKHPLRQTMGRTFTLDPRAAQVVENLSLQAEAMVEGFLSGLHRSPLVGYSTEFDSFRPYIQGDSPRNVDWKVWARTDKYHVKQFEDETNLRGWLLVDASASMDFGEGAWNKFSFARQVTAAIAYLMTRQHDAPGLVLFGQDRPFVLEPSSRREHLLDFFQALASAVPRGKDRDLQPLEKFISSLGRRGVGVVLSDFLRPDRQSEELLRSLRAQRQEVIVFHLLSPEECDLPYRGQFLLVDSETDEEMQVDSDGYRKHHRAVVRDFQDRVEALCLKHECHHHSVRTDEPVQQALLDYFTARAALP